MINLFFLVKKIIILLKTEIIIIIGAWKDISSSAEVVIIKNIKNSKNYIILYIFQTIPDITT